MSSVSLCFGPRHDLYTADNIMEDVINHNKPTYNVCIIYRKVTFFAHEKLRELGKMGILKINIIYYAMVKVYATTT